VKSTGRPKTYDHNYDHIIKKVADAKRALQQFTSAQQIQGGIKVAKLKPVPCVETVLLRQIALGVTKVAVKFKPQLTSKLMAQRKEKAQEIIDANAKKRPCR
jgi:hypothetical protein